MELPTFAFDSEVANGTPPNLLTGELSQVTVTSSGQSAFAVGVAAGVPAEIARAFLAELGLDEDAPVSLVLNFEEDDLMLAKRTLIIPDSGGSPTALHRALINGWLKGMAEAPGAASTQPADHAATPQPEGAHEQQPREDAPEPEPAWQPASQTPPRPGEPTPAWQQPGAHLFSTAVSQGMVHPSEYAATDWPAWTDARAPQGQPAQAVGFPFLSAPAAPQAGTQVLGHVRAVPLPVLSAVAPASVPQATALPHALGFAQVTPLASPFAAPPAQPHLVATTSARVPAHAFGASLHTPLPTPSCRSRTRCRPCPPGGWGMWWTRGTPALSVPSPAPKCSRHGPGTSG